MIFEESHFGCFGHPCWDVDLVVDFPSCCLECDLKSSKLLSPDFHWVPCGIIFAVLALPFPWDRRGEKTDPTSDTALLLGSCNKIRHLPKIPFPVPSFTSWSCCGFVFSWISVGIWHLGNIVYCLKKKKKDVTPLHCRDDHCLSQFYLSREQLYYRDAFIFSLSALYIPFSLLVGLSLPVGKGADQASQCHISLREMCIWLELSCIPDSRHSEHPLLTCSVLLPRQSCLRRKVWFHLWDFNFSCANCVCQLQSPTHWENAGNRKFSLSNM